MKPSNLLTDPISSFSPSSLPELLWEGQRVSSAAALHLTVQSLCDSFPLQSVWALQPQNRNKCHCTGSRPEKTHSHLPCETNISNSVCMSFPVPHYLESGVTFHRSRLSVTTAWTAASGLTPAVWDRRETQSVSSVNRPGFLPAQSLPSTRHLIQWWPTAALCFWCCHAWHAFRSPCFAQMRHGCRRIGRQQNKIVE